MIFHLSSEMEEKNKKIRLDAVLVADAITYKNDNVMLKAFLMSNMTGEDKGLCLVRILS